MSRSILARIDKLERRRIPAPDPLAGFRVAGMKRPEAVRAFAERCIDPAFRRKLLALADTLAADAELAHERQSRDAARKAAEAAKEARERNANIPPRRRPARFLAQRERLDKFGKRVNGHRE